MSIFFPKIDFSRNLLAIMKNTLAATTLAKSSFSVFLYILNATIVPKQ
jgi:hypothetical protein